MSYQGDHESWAYQAGRSDDLCEELIEREFNNLKSNFPTFFDTFEIDLNHFSIEQKLGARLYYIDLEFIDAQFYFENPKKAFSNLLETHRKQIFAYLSEHFPNDLIIPHFVKLKGEVL